MNVYDKYIALCNQVGKSPSAVAIEIGLSKPTISRWKKGGGLTDATAAKVAGYFNISVEDLISEEALDIKNKPANDSELSVKRLKLIDFAQKVPADKVDLVLKVMQSIVEDDE